MASKKELLRIGLFVGREWSWPPHSFKKSIIVPKKSAL
jgi:hypothetical protein